MKSVLEKDGNVRHHQSISVRYFEGIGKVYTCSVKVNRHPGFPRDDSGVRLELPTDPHP